MKRALFFILISLSFVSYHSSVQNVGDTVFYDTGDKYIGEMENSLANGYGKMFWVDGI